MQRIILTLALAAIFVFHSVANANFGPAQPGEAIALYDVLTGEITVSVNGLVNWFVQSDSSSLTGDDVTPGALPAGGGVVSDNDVLIGESTGFFSMTYTDISLGNVAATNLPFDDLTITGLISLGSSSITRNVFYSNVPYVHAFLNGPIVVDLATDPLNITLDASGSFSSEPGIQYSWDVDSPPDYEISTGTTPSLEIADVVATFGGVGVYHVLLRTSVLDAGDSARTTVTIINTIPEPTTLALAGLGLSLILATRRIRICA